VARSITLTEALELYFRHAHDLAPRTHQNMRQKLRCWALHAGEIRIRCITTETFETFRSAAAAAGLAPFTIQTTLDCVLVVLRHCGPRQSGVPHGRGLIPAVPYPGRRLRLEIEPKPAPTLDDLSAVYRVADKSKRPLHGLGPALFWRSFLPWLYNTGLRSRDARLQEWTVINWDEKFVVCRASKTRKKHRLPINRTLARHLKRISAESGPIFPFARTAFYLQGQLDELCAQADVTRFTFQAVRRRTGIEFDKLSHGAGSLILGHTLPRGESTTFASYIPSLEILRPLADRLPQPAAFLK